MARVSLVFLALLILSGCSALKPKYVGKEYKEFEHELGCTWHTDFGPSFEYELESRGNSKILKVYSGRHKTKGTGFVKKRKIYKKYQKVLAYPPSYYTKYIGEEVVEKKEGHCIKAKVPGGSDKVSVRIYPSRMKGSAYPNKDGLVAIDLLEPAILAGKDRQLEIRTDSVVTYKEYGKKRERRERIRDKYILPKHVVNDLVSRFKSIEAGSAIPESNEAALAAKYAYDRYGDLKLSAEFLNKVEEAKAEARKKGIPARKTSAARGLLRLARINPIGMVAGLFLDLALSGGSSDNTRKLTFVDP